jgi:hypothetical protein
MLVGPNQVPFRRRRTTNQQQQQQGTITIIIYFTLPIVLTAKLTSNKQHKIGKTGTHKHQKK